MKRITIFLTLFSLIAFSCEKIEKLEDDIVHKGFNPYIILQPADSVGLISNNSCEKPFPFPSDSLVSEEFDFNHDGVQDFRITFETNYSQLNPSDSCLNYGSRISMKSLGMGNEIYVKDKNTKEIMIYEEGEDIINTSVKSSNFAILYLGTVSTNAELDLTEGNKFIGFKLMNGNYGWLRFFYEKEVFMLSVMDYAYNNNVNLKIKAGQKE